MSCNMNQIDLLDVFTVLDEKIQATKPNGWLDVINLVNIGGDFKKEALELWANVMYKNGMQILRYARAVSIMNNNHAISEEDMQLAINMIVSGKDKDILNKEE